jgi:DNA-binding CsgD family transcriptional regulator
VNSGESFVTANLQPKELISLLQQEEIVPQPPHLRGEERRRAPRRAEDRCLQQLGSMARWMMELDGRSVFLLDRSASVVASNASAQRLLQEASWAQVVGGKLTFAMPSVQTWLLMSMAAAERRASLPMGSAEDRTLLRLHHIARDVAVNSSEAEQDEAGELFVLAIGDSPPSTVMRDDLRAAFGLTAAEAAVASELYTGKSLARVAEVLGLSVNTVKTHVKRVFRKCGVRSHVQLVKRVDGIA